MKDFFSGLLAFVVTIAILAVVLIVIVASISTVVAWAWSVLWFWAKFLIIANAILFGFIAMADNEDD